MQISQKLKGTSKSKKKTCFTQKIKYETVYIFYHYYSKYIKIVKTARINVYKNIFFP